MLTDYRLQTIADEFVRSVNPDWKADVLKHFRNPPGALFHIGYRDGRDLDHGDWEIEYQEEDIVGVFVHRFDGWRYVIKSEDWPSYLRGYSGGPLPPNCDPWAEFYDNVAARVGYSRPPSRWWKFW